MFAVISVVISAVISVFFSAPISAATTSTVRLDRNRFIPADIRAHPGDTLRFVNGQGGPHNVMFEKDSIAPAAQKAIDAAIGKQRLYFLAGPILILEGETFTFVVPELPPGKYPLYCNPHYGQMRGSLIIE